MITTIGGRIQPYAWGSTTAIPELLGRTPSGEPQAELWLGAHPLAPSDLDGTPLDQAVSRDAVGLVGQRSVERFGPRLPYLTKIIAAAQPLSLQAHPSREQAEAGFAREQQAGVALDAANRTYKDDWPKPEMICALGEFHALCGFRDPVETYAMFSTLGVDQVLDVVEPLRGGGPEAVQKAFARLLYAEHPEMLVSVVITLCQGLVGRDDALGSFARTAVGLGEHYPTDPGVLAGLMMNKITLQENEAMFLPAGNLHAYLDGTGVEVMANSDNVLRGGLTPKFVDRDELLDILDFTPGQPDLVVAEEEQTGVFRYRTPAPEFAVWRLAPHGGTVTLPADGSGRIVLVTDGEVALGSGLRKTKLSRGQAAFVTAGETGVGVKGSGTAFVSAPGV
ncbi:mannose-6-phosphate isomerase [Friedmanniella endophytica]|uniref:mannose-6-phosphate isomerase n=1 Tax=Microlunatus kandeliicorticis TaxID=1759536 RepID=A0A7W3IT31_9ACTN|nr:mannose-6-phosphate isomerase, class I [Microlunatus kandeliicorticis]MBA8794741.1 mannose-6-phosphate isomerase [Microlunatus kandeliicorticis]